MRSLRAKIKKLSLTQQLVMIVALALGFFLFFIFGTMSININQLVDKQVYDLVLQKQNDVVFNYRNEVPDDILFGSPDANVTHLIFNDSQHVVSNHMNINRRLQKQIETQLHIVNDNDKAYYGSTEDNLYILRLIEEDTYIATIIPKSYSNNYRTLLLNNVVNLIIIIISIIIFVLLVWVTSIIHPLNQIRNYILKIQAGEDAELKVSRQDEIGALANAIVAMNEEIRYQERMKEEMIQNISHDLKTPIATIKSYSEAIKDGIYPYETLEKSVDVILEHADRLEKKVFNLLTLNRMDYITSEQKDLNHEFDLNEIIGQVIVSSSELRKDLSIQVEGEGSMVYGSEEPWRVVIENLIDNAIRYAKSEILITTEKDFISVYNDGSQVNVDKMDQLFKAYEMGEGGQFGLGLSIVYKVVQNYGYIVYAENIDDGVRFVIRKGTHDKQ